MGGNGAKSETAQNYEKGSSRWYDAKFHDAYRVSARQIKGTGRTIKPSEMKGSYDIRVPDVRDFASDQYSGKLFYAIMNPISKSNPGSIHTTASEAHAAIKSGKFGSAAKVKGIFLEATAGNGEHSGQYAYTPTGWRKLEKEVSYY